MVNNQLRCRFKPYWVPLATMYNATASSAGLNQGGHRGVVRVTAQPGALSLAVPASYQATVTASEESDDPSDRLESTTTSTTTSSSHHNNGFGTIASVLLAFCGGLVIGAFVHHANNRVRTASNAGYSSELSELR